MKKQRRAFIFFSIMALLLAGCAKSSEEMSAYYLNSSSGNDLNDGLTPETAWKSLAKINDAHLEPGMKVLLAEGSRFEGKLVITGSGTTNEPIIVSSYSAGDDGNSANPVIDAKGYLTAIYLNNASNIQIENLELTSDAGEPFEEQAKTLRYGVLIEAENAGFHPNIKLSNLHIHHIFATENVEKDGQNPTSNLGYGIFIRMKNNEARIKNVTIEDCKIEMTGHTGIRAFGSVKNDERSYLDSLTIVNNVLENIGGPGMVPGLCKNVLVRGNVTNYTGSDADPRMHNRGSGIWPWTSENVLIEKNKFMNAWGKMDSYGAHIDYNCKNVVVQYNLSVNNSGGFVEILGNDHNCCYRYNVSINDGYRQKGVKGVVHDGKVLWTSGYVGKAPRKGPFNSYIYNNTIFVKEEYDTRFSFAKTTDGILIANNIFYIMGKSIDVNDNEAANSGSGTIQNVVFMNNLYQRSGIIPESVIIQDAQPLFGDPQFKNPGGLNAEDYIPDNIDLIKDKGITIEPIPGDPIGLSIGLDVEYDYFGNKIDGLPDLGAIQCK